MDITRFERAYQAAARIISTLDELYQTVLSL
jgi:flagellar hook-associated protein FlgK